MACTAMTAFYIEVIFQWCHDGKWLFWFAVVCAGVKSVLDIPRTLEFLETQGVSVAALGTGKPPSWS